MPCLTAKRHVTPAAGIDAPLSPINENVLPRPGRRMSIAGLPSFSTSNPSLNRSKSDLTTQLKAGPHLGSVYSGTGSFRPVCDEFLGCLYLSKGWKWFKAFTSHTSWRHATILRSRSRGLGGWAPQPFVWTDHQVARDHAAESDARVSELTARMAEMEARTMRDSSQRSKVKVGCKTTGFWYCSQWRASLPTWRNPTWRTKPKTESRSAAWNMMLRDLKVCCCRRSTSWVTP